MLDGISRADLRAQAVASLLAAPTVAGKRVFDPHTQPFNLTEFPALVVTTPAERKESNGLGSTQFLTTITLAIMGRVAPGSEQATEAQLDLIIEQVHRAILCATPGITDLVQQMVFVETQSIVTPEGEQFVGEAVIMFGCQVWQLYRPDTGAPLTEIVTTIPAEEGSGPPVLVDTVLAQ